MDQQPNSSFQPSAGTFILANKCENTGMSFPMHRHSDYEFYYVLEGIGQLYLDNEVYDVIPGLLCLFAPHNLHSVHIPADITYRRITLNFSQSYLQKMPFPDKDSHFKPIILSEKERLFFCQICSNYTAFSYQTGMSEDLKQTLISDILSLFLPAAKSCSTASPVLSEIHSYVDYHVHSKLNCQEIADALHYSVRQLNRIFTKSTNETLHHYILRAKISHIEELLLQGFSPTCISQKMGYSSSAAMTRFFRNEVGLTPGKWLAKFQQGI